MDETAEEDLYLHDAVVRDRDELGVAICAASLEVVLVGDEDVAAAGRDDVQEFLARDPAGCWKAPLEERGAVDVIVLRAGEDQVFTNQLLRGGTVLPYVSVEVRTHDLLGRHEPPRVGQPNRVGRSGDPDDVPSQGRLSPDGDGGHGS